jgi:16S rRNA G527 N7-methylase RsmG
MADFLRDVCGYYPPSVRFGPGRKIFSLRIEKYGLGKNIKSFHRRIETIHRKKMQITVSRALSGFTDWLRALGPA